MKQIKSHVLTGLGYTWLFAVWYVLTSFHLVKPIILPSIADVAHAFIRLTQNGELVTATLISLRRILSAFAIAMVVGGGLGLLAGYFRTARLLLQPTASFLRYIPPTAFVALFILYFGIGEGYKLAVIIAGNIFFIFAMTMDAVAQVDTRYLEMCAVTGVNRWGQFKYVILRMVAPRMVDITRINISGAWIFLVVAEITGSDGGLGFMIAQAQRFLRTDELFVGIIAFGIIGLVTDKALQLVGRKLFPWDQASQKVQAA
jgi:NitT/TauT family transport system permease protein